jgi:rSAM/selenodomain-associated transferase 1
MLAGCQSQVLARFGVILCAMKMVFVFARAPQLGRVKQRLARGIGAESALSIYVAMLRDSLHNTERVAQATGGRAVLAFTPADALDEDDLGGASGLREMWSGELWPQPEGDLGARMHGAIAWAFGRGASAVALLGADVPDLCVAEAERAFGLLDSSSVDVVLGPARDGGFWILACRSVLPHESFNLDWEQDETCAPLQKNLEAHGLRVLDDVAVADDVDDVRALQRLAERLRTQPELAPHTAQWLREHPLEALAIAAQFTEQA